MTTRSKRYLVSKKKAHRRGWKSLSKGEKSDLVRFIQIFGAIIIILFLLYSIGIGGLTHIGGFWSIFTGDREDSRGDTMAPPPPTFTPLSPYTKSEAVDISGYAEPAAEITLFVNGDEKGKAITEAGGTFKFSEISLVEGRNVITASAADRAGNTSQKSSELIITLDREPPKLEVSKPKDGQKFTGEDKQIKVEGKSEPGVTVKVNGIQATVLADGIFRATVAANKPGEIKITIVAKDKAGNEEKVELTVTYEAG